MSGAMVEDLHLQLTPARAGSSADSARAAAIATALREAIRGYADPRAAEAAGFRPFAPQVKDQRVFHYTRLANALAASVRFDPARPTSLLYARGADGGLRLIGAMYTAPRTASLEELDRRVPLGVARWHRHVNLCLPRSRSRWRDTRNGMPVFGPASPIATRAACDSAGGVFRPAVFGWMVHANVMAGDDPAGVWSTRHLAHAH